MRVLLVYASKYGSTEAIAERLADRLRTAYHDVDVCRAREAPDPSGFDVIVIGSAVYSMRWMREVTAFVRRHSAALAERPVWLFSSGPLGSEPRDADGRDIREQAQPKEIEEFTHTIGPRGHRVFWGALDPSKLGLGTRLARLLPAARAMMPEGDFRDWADVDTWGRAITDELASRNDGR